MHKSTVYWSVALLASFVCGFAASAQLSAQRSELDPLDAVVAAPKNHRVLFEDDHIRILEVTVQPGETENIHIHRNASVQIYDGAQPRVRTTLAGGGGAEVGRNFEGYGKAIAASTMPAAMKAALSRRETELPAALEMGWPAAAAIGQEAGAPHQATDIDTFPMHFYRFEFKRLDGNDIIRKTKY